MVVNTDPSTQQQAIVIVCIVAPTVCSLFVAMRIWTRTFVSHSIGKDDYAAIATLLLAIAYSVLIGLGTNYGFGWHTADIPSDHLVEYKKWDFISSIFYLVTLFGYKFTILLLYLRLFGVNDRFRYSTWLVMFFVFGYLFSNLLTSLFGCTPIELTWNAVGGYCIDRQNAGLAYGSMNFISDFFIFILPMPMVWRLRLSRKGKLGVMLVFMGGGIAFVVALVRYSLLLHMIFSTDPIWYDGKNLLWMVLEVNTGLICSCTPALRPFLDHFASGGLLIPPRKQSLSPRRWDDDNPMNKRKSRRHQGFVVFDINDINMKGPFNKAKMIMKDV